MANPQGSHHDRLRSLLGAETPTHKPKGEAPAEAKTDGEETPQSDTEPKSRRVKAKLNDRDIEFDVLTEDVDLDIIPKGLMMEADYRKKTSEVAERRKSLEAKEQELATQVQELEQILFGEAQYLDSDEMKQLRDEDPEEYYRQRNKFESKVQKVKKYKDKAAEEMNKKHQEIVKAEQAKWKQVIPEWLDDSKMDSDLKKMSKTLIDAGFSESDLGNIYDHRLIKLIHKASLFDEISSKPIETKRAKEPPRSQKPGGGVPQPVNTKTSRDRLKKTGRRDDAQAAIKDLLGL